MDGWESTSLAGAAEGRSIEQILKIWDRRAGSFASYGAVAVVDVGLGVSPDKTYQNKPVPYWQVNRELFHRSLRYGWDVRTLKRGAHD